MRSQPNYFVRVVVDDIVVVVNIVVVVYFVAVYIGFGYGDTP